MIKKQPTKKLIVIREVVRTLAYVRGGIPISPYPELPPTQPTTGPTGSCPPNPTNSCDGCTLITF